MPISKLYEQGHPVVSFEVFPPKREGDIADIFAAIGRMAALNPDYISVTYGAGGGGNIGKTTEIASFIERECAASALAHITCAGLERDGVVHRLDTLRKSGVQNLLALRGDISGGARQGSYRYAAELISEIRSIGGFCIGAACYPEGHIECDDPALDINHMLKKQMAGADFFITQLFFDNDCFFRFIEMARTAGVTAPISAGVMPILGRSQIERMIFMCGASLPSNIIRLLHKYENHPADLRRAGVEYAAVQLEGLLAGGAQGVHIYTMNKPEIAEHCMKHIGRA